MAKDYSDFELDELAAEAKNLQNSKVMKLVFERLEKQYIDKLKNANIGDLTVPSLHASLRVLEGVKGEIDSFITDLTFRNLKK